MSEKSQEAYIEQLRKVLEKNLNWGPVQSWHSKMFEELSEKVFESTQTMLSVATLKRFFGVVKHEGLPSTTTLDALSQFVGKENWRGFKVTARKPKLKWKVPAKSMYVTLGFLLAVVTITLIGNRRPNLEINASEFSFSSRTLSDEYPNSVVFDFEIPEHLDTDSLHIQQYWDPTKTIKLQKGQTQATGIYYFPGYFRAKLMVEGQEAQAHDLFLKTQGWLGMIEYRPVPKYFQPEERDNGLSISDEILKEVSARDSPILTSYHWIDDLGTVSGDHFTFQSTVQSVFDDRWGVCQSTWIYFIGTTGAMIIPFSKIGCSSDLDIMMNDVYLRGKEHDLSALSADFSASVDLEIAVKNKIVHVLIDGREVYENKYETSMGKLVGVRFKFLGAGEVLSSRLVDGLGQHVPLP